MDSSSTQESEIQKSASIQFSPIVKPLSYYNTFRFSKNKEINRCVSSFKAHEGTIKLLTLINKNILLSASYDGYLHFWGYQNFTFNLMLKIKGNLDGIDALCKTENFVINAAQSASGNNIHIWSIDRIFKFIEENYEDEALEPNYKTFLYSFFVNCHNNIISAITAIKGQKINTFASASKSIKIWHVNSKLIKEFQGRHQKPIQQLKQLQSENYLVSSGLDKRIKI